MNDWPRKFNVWLERLLPSQPALVLDVGAGSERDRAWLVSLGHQVIAVEPSERTRIRGRRLHAAEQIPWNNDRLAQKEGQVIQYLGKQTRRPLSGDKDLRALCGDLFLPMLV